MDSESKIYTNGKHHGFNKDLKNRIFTNRSVNLNKIQHYGFDMDYTLAIYKWPVYDEALFMYALDYFVERGFPGEIGKLKCDIDFPVRGLWFDKTYGTFLKVDSFGNILMCARGYKQMTKKQIEEIYPGRFVTLNDRMYIFNTPFHIPELMFFAAVINYFVERDINNDTTTNTGVHITPDKVMTYSDLFTDLREAIEAVHGRGEFKKFIMEHLSEYVEKCDETPQLLDRLHKSGKNVFLVTNSDWEYTNSIMSYVCQSDEQQGSNWVRYFDLIVTDSRKPKFFTSGTPLWEIDPLTGVHLAVTEGTMERGKAYKGGNVSQLEDALGITGKSVLYIGDHIYGDILKCKKNKGWKTFLVVEELDHQLAVWIKCQSLIKELEQIDAEIDERYLGYTRNFSNESDCRDSKQNMRNKINQIDLMYGKLGGLFHSGSRETFFASQVKRYADIYAKSCTHLNSYPLSYLFKSTRQKLPHEIIGDDASILDDASRIVEDDYDDAHRDKNRMTGEQTVAMVNNLPNVFFDDASNSRGESAQDCDVTISSSRVNALVDFASSSDEENAQVHKNGAI